jgi:hypothetical protein
MVTVGAPEIVIIFSVALVTVSCVVPLMPLDVAVIVTGVALTVSAVTNPFAAILATDVLEDIHVAVAVRSSIDPLLYVPVAVSCVSVPTGTESFAGVTAIESSVGGITVNVVVPITAPTVAVIVVIP